MGRSFRLSVSERSVWPHLGHIARSVLFGIRPGLSLLKPYDPGVRLVARAGIVPTTCRFQMDFRPCAGVLLVRWFPMPLVFNGLEVAAILLTALPANQVTQEGESTWIEGLELLSVYTIMVLVFLFA